MAAGELGVAAPVETAFVATAGSRAMACEFLRRGLCGRRLPTASRLSWSARASGDWWGRRSDSNRISSAALGGVPVAATL